MTMSPNRWRHIGLAVLTLSLTTTAMLTSALADEAGVAEVPVQKEAADPANQPADKANADEQSPRIEKGAFGNINLVVNDVEISKVLQGLSVQSKRNIIASRNVSGKVTANLYQVNFYEALDAILAPNGLGYREKGNFIYVYTQQELKQIEEANRKMVSEVIKLSYLRAADAETFVSPMLSPGGAVTISNEAPTNFKPSTADAGADTNAFGNILVVRDYPEKIEEVMSVIERVDVRPEQVMIEAVVLEVSLTEKNKLGVDFSVIIDSDMAKLANPLSSVDALIGGAITGKAGGVQSTVGNTASADDSFKIGIVNNDFSVFLSALARVTDTTVLAKPKVLVLNRQSANLLVGGRRGYVTTEQTETTTTQTIEFLEIGTQLTVRPFIGDDGFIRLELQPSISDGTVENVGGFVVPSETTQELTTNVMLRNGQTVVLGGLFRESTVVTRRRVPFLGDVPVIGNAFKGSDDDVVRNEYIFMIKPTIVKDENLHLSGKRGEETVELARVGAREGLLPFSREKLLAHHMRKALELQDQGKTDQAKLHVDWALSIDPRLQSAQLLKEELGGKRPVEYRKQLLQSMVDEMVDEKLGSEEKTESDTPKMPAAPTTENQKEAKITPAPESTPATSPEQKAQTSTDPAKESNPAKDEKVAELLEELGDQIGKNVTNSTQPESETTQEPESQPAVPSEETEAITTADDQPA